MQLENTSNALASSIRPEKNTCFESKEERRLLYFNDKNTFHLNCCFFLLNAWVLIEAGSVSAEYNFYSILWKWVIKSIIVYPIHNRPLEHIYQACKYIKFYFVWFSSPFLYYNFVLSCDIYFLLCILLKFNFWVCVLFSLNLIDTDFFLVFFFSFKEIFRWKKKGFNQGYEKCTCTYFQADAGIDTQSTVKTLNGSEICKKIRIVILLKAKLSIKHNKYRSRQHGTDSKIKQQFTNTQRNETILHCLNMLNVLDSIIVTLSTYDEILYFNFCERTF